MQPLIATAGDSRIIVSLVEGSGPSRFVVDFTTDEGRVATLIWRGDDFASLVEQCNIMLAAWRSKGGR